jgi:hypothetical protein
MRRTFALGSLALLTLTSFVAFTPAERAAAQAPDAGHCAFTLKNQWVGPLKACMDPATPQACSELGGRDENSSAVHGAGQCPVEGRVGTCAKSDSAMHYYEGDADGLEVGCGFQGGEWKKGA